MDNHVNSFSPQSYTGNMFTGWDAAVMTDIANAQKSLRVELSKDKTWTYKVKGYWMKHAPFWGSHKCGLASHTVSKTLADYGWVSSNTDGTLTSGHKSITDGTSGDAWNITILKRLA